MNRSNHPIAEEFSLQDESLDLREGSSAPQQSFHLTSYIIGLLTALILVGGSDLLFRRPTPPAIALQPPPTLAPTATPPPTATSAPIVVFVSGAVQQPGMYALDAQTRVGDALKAAGGLTLQANVALVNQAERLWDGAQIHVPAIQATPQAATANGLPTADVTASEQSNEISAGLSGAGTPPVGRSGLANHESSTAININRASPSELETLPGIGPSKAAAIVANRPYLTVDELERVPGIGAKTVEQLRPLVVVE